MTTARIEEAIKIYGKEKVDEIIMLCEMADPDAIYSSLIDEDEDGAAIVEMIYFT